MTLIEWHPRNFAASAVAIFPAHRAILSVDGVSDVHVNLVWTPRWDPKIHASEDARMDMGIW